MANAKLPPTQPLQPSILHLVAMQDQACSSRAPSAGQCRLPPAELGQASSHSTSDWVTAPLADNVGIYGQNSTLCCTWLPCRYCVFLLRQAEVLHDLTLASAGQATQPAWTGMGTGKLKSRHKPAAVRAASQQCYVPQCASLPDLGDLVEV